MRVSEVAEKLLPSALGAMLHRAFSETDQSLWFINRLDVVADVNVAWEPHQLGHCLAVRTAQSLCAELAAAANGGNVIRFSSPAEYLAAFLTALAQGRAWNNWYYDSFDGLRMLPTSAALRTAVCRDVSTGLVALHLLQPAALKGILLQLTDADAERIFQTFANELDASEDDSDFDHLETLLANLQKILLEEWSDEKASLLLYIEVSRERGLEGRYALAQAMRAIVVLSRCLNRSSGSQRDRLLNTLRLANGDIASLYQTVGPAAAERMTPLLSLRNSSLLKILDVVSDRPKSFYQEEASLALRDTRFGGVFFLLPLIDQLPLSEATEGWPDADGAGAEAMIRWLILLKCFGKNRSFAAARDPLIQELASLPPDSLSRERVHEWQRRITPNSLGLFLSRLARWRLENGTATGALWVLGHAVSKNGHLAILLDAQKGCWLFLVRANATRRKRLASLLATTFANSPTPVEALLCDPLWREVVSKVNPQFKILDLNDREAVDNSELTKPAEIILRAVPRLGEELDYFTFPPEFGLSASVDRVISVAAQGLMRDFAWRLPGFAWSGTDYLYQNFLDSKATVEDEPERRVVTLGRSPLHLLLNMTGINRRHYELSWSRGQRIELYPEHV